jgi:hypothetical protein
VPRNSSRIAALKTSAPRLHAAFAGLVCGAILCACKSRDAAPTPPSHAPAATGTSTAARVEPKAFRLPPEPTFELPDDAPIDPAESQRAMRHNCCDEMPAAEVEATIRAGESTGATAPTPRRLARARRHPRD